MNDLADLLAEFDRLDRLDRGRSDADAWVGVAEQVIEADPTQVRVWSKLARYYEGRGEWARALLEWRSIVEASPDSAEANRSLRVAERIVDSDRTRRAEHAERQREIEKLIEASGDYSELLELGFQLREEGTRADAERVFARAVELGRRSDPKVIIGVALALRRQDEPSIALPLAQYAAGRLETSYASTVLGRIHRSLKNYDAAVASYEDALERARRPEDGRVARTALGAVYRELDQPQRAEALARTVIAEAPRDAPAYNLLGGALSDQKEADPEKGLEAVECFERAKEYGPVNASTQAALRGLLDWLLRTRDDHQSVERVERILAALPRRLGD